VILRSRSSAYLDDVIDAHVFLWICMPMHMCVCIYVYAFFLQRVLRAL